ncbi:MAG TPA: CoA transferase [Candidatus Tectomicrobia bacterium]|nr:CoA transferase [Candidatus Tectomicrobia bacterium]
MTSVLDGIRVIDFGQYIAGPLAGMLLADHGADVIRIDPPGGPMWNTPANATWNRGKRSIILNLKQPDDVAIATQLIASADVVIENFRPGVMERLGLGPQAAMRVNPRLVYCSLPGFASDDPRAQVRAFEGVVGAATATYRPLTEGSDRPVYTAIPISSNYAAFQAVVSIVVALLARQRDGVGQRIEVPLFDATFPSIGARAMRVHDPAHIVPTPRGIWGGGFECADGRWVQFGGSGNQNFRPFVEAAGITAWDEEGLTDIERLMRDPELFAEHLRRARELFKTRTAQEWEDLVAKVGSECAVCRTSAEWFEHPHARDSRMVIEVDDPQYGKMLQPGVNVRLSRTPGAVRWPAPKPDQHRAEILAELDARPRSRISPTLEGTVRTALEGVRVLDLCIILAGPTLGRTLAEFGADVIKIDNPTRGGYVASHNDVNRGKRSILLDLKSEAGRNIFWRLLANADVVAQNYRAGKLEKLGLSYEEVRRRKPDIIYASLNAFGHLGPWAQRPGHEQFAQAATGMQRRFGGDGPPAIQPNPINDYGTGFMGAYAVALALWHRQRTGEGQHVDTALAYTAMMHQSPFMQLYDGKRWDEPSGQDKLGSGPLHRAYHARDGWLFIGARRDEGSRLAAVEGLTGIDSLRGRPLEHALEQLLAGETVDTWVARLTRAGVGAHRYIGDVGELMADPWVTAHELSLTREHDGMGLVTTCGPAPRLSRTPIRVGQPAPKPGADAHEILTQVGLSDREIAALIEAGVVRVDGVAAG